MSYVKLEVIYQDCMDTTIGNVCVARHTQENALTLKNLFNHGVCSQEEIVIWREIIVLPHSRQKIQNKQRTRRKKLNTKTKSNIDIWISPGYKMRGGGSNKHPPHQRILISVLVFVRTKNKSWKH